MLEQCSGWSGQGGEDGHNLRPYTVREMLSILGNLKQLKLIKRNLFIYLSPSSFSVESIIY
jgi:hypothetical protein